MQISKDSRFMEKEIMQVMSDSKYLSSVEDCLRKSEEFKMEFPYDLPLTYCFFSYLHQDGELSFGPIHKFKSDELVFEDDSNSMRNLKEGAINEGILSDFYELSNESAFRDVRHEISKSEEKFSETTN